MMTYQQCIDFLYQQLPMFQREGKAAYKANLNNTLAMDEYFGQAHRKFKSIHIAGTNGKGSVSHTLASILQESGLRVGLYTSPHLKDFRERIRINGEMISEQHVTQFVSNNLDFFAQLKPSFFEITVAMAFEYFAQQQVDVAVIEVGLGGRLDSTNILLPLLSVITNISLDHTELLGQTIADIAYEKAGIIKTEIPIVIGKSDPITRPVFLNKANEKQASIFFADLKFTTHYSLFTTDNLQTFNILHADELKYENLKTDLLGNYQKENIITVLQSIDLLTAHFSISTENIYQGIQYTQRNTGLRGRWQTLGNNPRIICDTGHNEAGIEAIVKQIQNTPYKKLHFVFGMVNDKNNNKILKLLPKNATYYFTKANIPRALDANKLQQEANNYELYGKSYPSVILAITAAKQNALPEDFIFIGGSTFVVAEAI